MFSAINSDLVGVHHNNPLQHQQQQQNPYHMHHQSHMVLPFGSSHEETETHQQQQQPINKHGNYPPFLAKNKHQQQQQGSSLSDDEDPDTLSGEPSKRNKSSNISPWQRMKWTDTMVRLLIMAVYYIGDEGGCSTSEGIISADPNGNNKKIIKPFTGLLQKKGKWKSVSKAMMEKGFYVSPQQCEDKFNDLNKRYKRVNDILGKGTACKVVENQKLLDTMDHLSQKVKEEVRKLLNSKHLFFREMCAYHNSCGHGANYGSGGGGGGSGSVLPQQVEVGNDASQQQQEQQQKCLHSPDEGVATLANLNDDGDDDDGDDDDDDESEDYSDYDEDESGEGVAKGLQGGHGNEDDQEDNDHEIIRSPWNNKRSRKDSSPSLLMQQLSNEVNGVFQDGGKSIWEKKQWLRSRIVLLEKKQVSYESQGFELEKQKLKWKRFSSKKERETEKAKLENERRRLQNERMVLLIRQKEHELMNLQQLQQLQHSPS